MIPYDELCAALERHRRGVGPAETGDMTPPPYEPHQTPIEGSGGIVGQSESGEISLDAVDVVDEV
jgi:hypothetical protein